MANLNVLVAGCTSYIGIQLIKLLINHKRVKIKYLCGNSSVGKRISFFDKSIKKKLPKITKFNKNKLKDVAMSGTRKLSRSGKTAIKLKTGDRLIGVISVIENDDVQLATTNGKSIRFATKDLREFSGLGSAGVRGIKLAKDDKVVSICSLLHNKISIDVRESYLKAKNEAKKDSSKMNKNFKN